MNLFLVDLDPIEQAIELYEEAKTLVELRHSRILDPLSSLTPADRLSKAVELYWTYQKLFTAVQLAQAIGMEKRNFQAACKANSLLNIEEFCVKCKTTFSKKATSKHEYQQHILFRRRYKYPHICENCRKEESEENDRQWQGRQASQEIHIKSLREMPYSEYLITNHWKQLRFIKLKRAKFRCEMCFNNRNLQVHHKTYERRGCEDLSDLIVLCENCHGKFHDKLEREASNG